MGHGFVAAGGQNSQLDVRRLGGGEIVYKGHCGGSVNNALHVARDASRQASPPRPTASPRLRSMPWLCALVLLCAGGAAGAVPLGLRVASSAPASDHTPLPATPHHSSWLHTLSACTPRAHPSRPGLLQLRLFVCNNDDTVKVYGLASGALVTMLRCPVAINYCALSPCGRCGPASRLLPARLHARVPSPARCSGPHLAAAPGAALSASAAPVGPDAARRRQRALTASKLGCKQARLFHSAVLLLALSPPLPLTAHPFL